MGNICCQDDDPPRPKINIQPVVKQTNNQMQVKRSSSVVKFDNQKNMLEEYPLLVSYIRGNGEEGQVGGYVKFYVNGKISFDQVGEYYHGILVEDNGGQRQCIVKKINKNRLTEQEHKKSVALQYLITKYVQGKFIVKCLWAYEGTDSVFMFFDIKEYSFLNNWAYGGKRECMDIFWKDVEKSIRFVIAGILLGLEKMHKLGIIYRGINFQNIVITTHGYPLLTNLSRVHPNNQKGATPLPNAFSAPQQFKNEVVSVSTDFWALGVLIYYFCKCQFINYSSFKERQFKGEGISEQLNNLVNSLLILDPEERLGSRGVDAIKNHPFFEGFDWKQYEDMHMESPLIEGRKSLPKESFTRENTMQSSISSMDGSAIGGAGLTSMLFMDLATIYMISEALQSQKEQPIEYQPEAEEINEPYNIEEYQMATEIDIGGDDCFDIMDD